MRYRSLGSSGLLVSVVGLGCNNFGRRLDVNGTRAVVDAAIDAGITLFDTADTYGGDGASETLLGEVLGGRRSQIVLATKFGHRKVDMGYGPAAGAKGGRAYIKRAVTESLRRLRTDYIDLYQLHKGASILDVAIGGLAAQPGCSSVIAGAMTPEQVKANVVAGDWTPTPAQVAELDAIVPPSAADD